MCALNTSYPRTRTILQLTPKILKPQLSKYHNLDISSSQLSRVVAGVKERVLGSPEEGMLKLEEMAKQLNVRGDFMEVTTMGKKEYRKFHLHYASLVHKAAEKAAEAKEKKKNREYKKKKFSRADFDVDEINAAPEGSRWLKCVAWASKESRRLLSPEGRDSLFLVLSVDAAHG
jgi:hypothetical protein